VTRAAAAASALLFVIAVAVAGAASGADNAAKPRMRAAGGQSILAASMRASAVVAGTISSRRPIDDKAWTAALVVDESVTGPVAVGKTTTITWEELSASRQVRFDDGERVLVVLDPVPDQTLWTRRMSRPENHADYIVAEHGDAFVRSPDPGSLDALLHYLMLAPQAQGGAPGAVRLVELAEAGNAVLAAEAITLLGQRKNLANDLGDPGTRILLHIAESPRNEAGVRTAALRLAAARSLPGTKETALALSQPGSAMRVEAVRALTALPSGLTPAQKLELLDDPDAAVRVIAIEVAGSAASRARIVEMMKKDSSPQVRLAAGVALVARDGSAALSDVMPLLDDPDAAVRMGMARRIGEVGSAAVEPLRNVVDRGSERAALAAVVGLTRAGHDGAAELVLLAHSHPNEKVKTFASLALGKAPDADKH